ncbi:MAG: 50S ribosomal protein L15 [Desulfobacterales bacterium]|nr:50S ribosomal protein L15 [Desulfobacterales bacterium]MBS3754448.1 50S ribosomal protein L15 [Desulfobacterales bacterium]
MRLHELTPEKKVNKARKRLGRGVASGQGKTAGRGTKGYHSRSGSGTRPGFEGGQMPLQRRLPKRGFYNVFKTDYAIVNIRDLNRFESGARVDSEAMVAAGLIKSRNSPVKLLGQGEISVAVSVQVAAISNSARQKVEAAGGKVEVK